MKGFFDWAGHSALANWMHDSAYAFPAFEMVHLVGLGLLLGSVFLLNIRFFGLGMRRQRVSDLALDFAPWTGLGLLLMVISGVPLFASKALDLWSEDRFGFFIKMELIAIVVVFHYFVLIPLAQKDNVGRGRIVAAFSLICWFGAAIAGLTLEFL